MAPSHYLNQCWNIVNWIRRNKFPWNFNRYSNIFIQENAFENVVCEMASILSRPQCVNTSVARPLQMRQRNLVVTLPTEDLNRYFLCCPAIRDLKNLMICTELCRPRIRCELSPSDYVRVHISKCKFDWMTLKFYIWHAHSHLCKVQVLWSLWH